MTSAQNINRASKILIIDDDATSRLIMSKFLEKNNSTVICAANGDIGVNLYKKHKDFDAVITDCEMPVMSGVQALSKIRQVDRELGTSSALFVVTGKDRKEMNSLFNHIDICEYFQKPVDLAAFYKTIISYLLE